jgi:DNA-binding GntR family transcriptional regulator
LIESSGFKPSIKPLSVIERSPNIEEKRALHLLNNEKILALERLFQADGTAVILANNSLPIRLLNTNFKHLDASLSIQDFLWRYCHRNIAYAISDVSSEIAGEELIDVLSFQKPRALLKITIVFYDRDNQPLIYGKSFFDDSRLRLSLVQAWGG